MSQTEQGSMSRLTARPGWWLVAGGSATSVVAVTALALIGRTSRAPFEACVDQVIGSSTQVVEPVRRCVVGAGQAAADAGAPVAIWLALIALPVLLAAPLLAQRRPLSLTLRVVGAGYLGLVTFAFLGLVYLFVLPCFLAICAVVVEWASPPPAARDPLRPGAGPVSDGDLALPR